MQFANAMLLWLALCLLLGALGFLLLPLETRSTFIAATLFYDFVVMFILLIPLGVRCYQAERDGKAFRSRQ
jgi:hypothetical protein